MAITTAPTLQQRPARPYLAIQAQATMPQLSTVLPELFSDIFGWLHDHPDVAQAGPPFVRYLVVDMEGTLEVEVGIPTATAYSGNGRVQSGELPAGRYATLIHTGDYAGLADATAELLQWAEQQGITWQTSRNPAGQEVWAGRFEFYLTDPAEQPDPAKWETELAFLTAQ